MDIPTHDEIVSRCEAFCRRHDMAETRFGREATGEPQLLSSIRSGRSPSLKVLQRVASFMADKDREAGFDPALADEQQDASEWPIASATNADQIIRGAEEREAPPFPAAAGEASPPRSSSTCSTIPALPPSPAASPACSTTGPAEEAEAA